MPQPVERRPRKLKKRRDTRIPGPGPYVKTGFPKHGFTVGLPFIPYKSPDIIPRRGSPLRQVTTCLSNPKPNVLSELGVDLSGFADDIVGAHTDSVPMHERTLPNDFAIKSEYKWIPDGMRVGLTPSMVFSDPVPPASPVLLDDTSLYWSDLADNVVGAHPDALPLCGRLLHPSTTETDFPWAPSGIKFSLIHQINTCPPLPLTPPPPVLSKGRLRSHDGLSFLRKYSQEVVSSPLRKHVKGKSSKGQRVSGKENECPLPPAQARIRRY